MVRPDVDSRPLANSSISTTVSLLIFFYLPVGALLAYLSPYLVERGLTLGQAGTIIAVLFAVKLVAGPLTVIYADRTRRHAAAAAVFTTIAVVAAWAISSSHEFSVIMMGVLAFSLARNYCQSVLESSVAQLGSDGRASYARLRFVGSVAVAVGVGVVGTTEDIRLFGFNSFALVLFVSSVGFFVVTIRSLRTGRGGVHATYEARLPTQLLADADARKRLALVLVVGALLIGSHGAMYSTASVALEAEGYSSEFIALCWVIAFCAEAGGFATYDWMNSRLGNRLAMVVAIMCGLRWIVFIEFEWSAPLVILAFASQVGTFGWVHSRLVLAVNGLFAKNYGPTGQAIYVAVAHGVGISAVSLTTARMFGAVGTHAFLIPLTVSLCGAMLLLRVDIGRPEEMKK